MPDFAMPDPAMPDTSDTPGGDDLPSGQGGIARFETLEARDRFVDEFFVAHPSIRERAVIIGSRPDIIFQSLDNEQTAKIQRALAGRGEWFEDMRFDPM
jgi:hypothetical protein